MKNFFNKYFWVFLIVLASIGLAGSAAYFSISGLSKLFAGSALQVIIMASFIEFSKIATTAALHRYWNSMKGLSMQIFKWFLVLMVIVVMAITSSGIYGFLADAYSKTSIELDKIQGKVELIKKQKEQKNNQIIGIEEIKNSKSNRITTLNNLRVSQENRIDSLYSKGWITNAKKTQNLIDQSTEEIKTLQIEIDSLSNKIQKINTEIGELDIEVLNLQNTDVTAEIASLKYISKITNKSMESIANYFIMAIIFVFDPLAVLLVVFASVVYDNSKNKNNETVVNKKNITRRLRDRFKKNKSKEDNEINIKEDNNSIEFNEKHQKLVDDINNSNNSTQDFKYDFPEEKGNEIIEYVEGENGHFKKNDESNNKISSLIKGIDSNPIYLQLIDVLFDDGNKKVGDIIPPYKSLVKNIKDRGIECDDKVIKNFLTICNLLEITNMSDKDNVKIIKDYSTSKGIISLVSK